MVEYITLNASAARQVMGHWVAQVNPTIAAMVGAGLLLAWLVWRAFVVRR